MNKEGWNHIVKAANSIRKGLDFKPQELKAGYTYAPGGVLNAYREGDLNFNEAVKAIEGLMWVNNVMTKHGIENIPATQADTSRID